MPVLKIMEFRYAVCRGPVWESDCLGLGNLFYVYFSLNQIILQVRCANFTIEVNGTCLIPYCHGIHGNTRKKR